MLKMSKEKKQHVCIKFCIKVGNNGPEAFEMLKTAFSDECLVMLTCVNSLRGSKGVRLQSMMICNPGDHQQAEITIL